jgi:hypothetical protein
MSPLLPAVLPLAVVAGVAAVNVVIAGLYAVTLWLSLLAYLLIIDGPWHLALLAGPLFISGGVVALLLLDAALCGMRWLWRSRVSWRWWRSAR